MWYVSFTGFHFGSLHSCGVFFLIHSIQHKHWLKFHSFHSLQFYGEVDD